MIRSTYTLKDYIEKIGENGSFVVPAYQRGYIWGQEKSKNEDSARHLIKTLIDGYKEKKEKIFLQGITVCVDGNNIELVDGQQRTTFLYLLLKYLKYEKSLHIEYKVRNESNDFLAKLNAEEVSNEDLSEDEPYQDIYFFKKTLRTIHQELENEKIEHKSFLDYILNSVNFLYIPIPKEKATVVFSMMNGNKSEMLQEELMKSELLRVASLKTEKSIISESENTAIRSRLAREWDTWLHWWNERQEFFKIHDQLGWLIPLYCNSERVSFEDFRNKNFKDASVRTAKLVFKKLRMLHKYLEDAYTDPISYNYIGAIINIKTSNSDRFAFLKWYVDQALELDKEHLKQELKRYFDWCIISVNHEDIRNKKYEKYNEAREIFLEALSNDQLYNNSYEVAARWLLRKNIKEDCCQEGGKGRKFDFSIWGNRSLEHIYPKSKVYHKDEEDGEYKDYKDDIIDQDKLKDYSLDRNDIRYEVNGIEISKATEHSIGNLVLLYKDNNSSFNNSDFQHKKEIFFRNVGDSSFKSRHLIHTISVFASSTWTGEDIAKRQKEEIEQYVNDYKAYDK